MKITRKELKKLIETFIGGPKGGIADMESIKNTPDLFALLEPYQEKVMNDPKVIKLGYAEKFKQLLNTNKLKDKLFAFMLARQERIISKEDHDAVKKIINDIKLLDSAKDLKKNPPKGMSIGYPGFYRSEEGMITNRDYAVQRAQQDDPKFDERLSQRIKEMIPDFKVFIKAVYEYSGDPTIYDYDLITEVVNEVTKMIKQRYGKIYTSGNILPTIKKILYKDFNIEEIVSAMSGKREEYSEYLDRTDLGMKIDSILEDVYDDVTVDSIIQKLKDSGYDETFFKESFEDPQGNLLFPQFDIKDYNEIMIYFLIDRITYSVDDVGFDGEVIYRMR